MRKANLDKLREINKSVYDRHKENLMKNELVAPLLKEMALEQVNDPSLPDYEKQRIQNILDTGMLDVTEEVIDTEAVALYEKELQEEIDKAVAKGILPKPPKRGISKKELKELWKTKK
jgi:hypothetical protein